MRRRGSQPPISLRPLSRGSRSRSTAHDGAPLAQVWDLVTRAALWSAPNSSGPWTRVTTLRNGSHIETLCGQPKASCRAPCKESCCSGTEANPSFVTWAPTLVHAPSSVNESGKDVWNLFCPSLPRSFHSRCLSDTRPPLADSSNQNSHMGDDAFNGITWAVSTTDSMEGPPAPLLD